MKHLIILVLLILLAPNLGIAGTAYYVDPKASGGGNGSYASPFNNIDQVNERSFSTGDDLYFRAGTTFKLDQKLNIKWSGTKSDRAVIGAYYGKGLFGLGGNKRPVFDGALHSKSFLGDYNAIIHGNGNYSYITIQDLEIRNSWSKGINLQSSDSLKTGSGHHNIVRNCRVVNTGRQGIAFNSQMYGLIENNYTEGTSNRKISTPGRGGTADYAGAAIEVNAGRNERVGNNCVIKGNTVTRSFESIGVYKGARYTTVANNIVYDFIKVGIYVTNSRNATIENNLVYQPKTLFRSSKNRGPLIVIDAEGHLDHGKYWTGHNIIRNNFLASGKVGLRVVSNASKHGVYQEWNQIYSNRIVDCDVNISFNKPDKGWHDNIIRDNYSFIFSGGVHTNNMNPPGFKWINNYFNSAVGGDAAKDAHINKVSLRTKTDWRSLKPGELKKEWFNLTDESESDETLPVVQNFKIIP